MGTTLDMLQRGSSSIVWVAAIGGYKYLLTSGTAAAAITAHGGDWSLALEGLHVDLQVESRLDPRQPFTAGGRCMLRVVKTTSADTLGVDTRRSSGGAETELRATADRDDTTLTVADTTAFDASGEAHIGTECFAYSGKTGTTFTGCTRGKYAPFPVSGGTRFAETHRIVTDPQQVKIKPAVTAIPRRWNDRWVGVWMHRVVNGVLDTKAQAQCVFAGKIVDVYDDAGGYTVLELRHALDVVQEATIGRAMWSAKGKEGVFLEEGLTFSLSDSNDITTTIFKTTNVLEVKVGAAGTNQMEEGYYTHDELADAVNPWLDAELLASRIYGTYQLNPLVDTEDGVRTVFDWRIPATGVKHVKWKLTMPSVVAAFLGYEESDDVVSAGQKSISDDGLDDTTSHYVSHGPPLKTVAFKSPGLHSFLDLQFTEERGTFFDNFDWLPVGMNPGTNAGDGYGVFLLDERILIVGYKDGDELLSCAPLFFQYRPAGELADLRSLTIPIDSGASGQMSIRQIYFIEAPVADLLRYLAYSTGNAGYNHADWDVFPYGLGFGLPDGVLGDDFIDSCDALPQGSAPIVLVLDKVTRISELLGSDLQLRRAFTRWRNGHLELGSWAAPTAANATIEFTQDNKAAPSNQKDNQRTASRLAGFGTTPVIRIAYNRSILAGGLGGGYGPPLVLEDPSAIDDAGGEGAAYTINARNVYAEWTQSGASVEVLAAGLLASMPLFSRPQLIVTRPIDLTLFEGIAVGDHGTLTDPFVGDPETGQRGVSQLPCTVIRHRYTPGGIVTPGAKPSPAGGEVDLLLLRQNRLAAYVPCAQVDDTATNAGYDDPTKTLTAYAHKHSEAAEAADASNFAAGDVVLIIEIDPADPAAPTSWRRTIASTPVGNAIVLTVALSAPAWDATKRYRIVYAGYTSVQTSQQTKAFQADDADALIANLAAPDQYAYGQIVLGAYTANDPTQRVELPPDASFGDGVGLDVGHVGACNGLAMNLLDYKTARSSPRLYDAACAPASATGSQLELVEVRPIFLSAEQLSTSIRRVLSVAPQFKSNDGSTVTLRITLTRSMPSGSTCIDVDRGTQYAEATFTTNVTTYDTPAAQDLDIGDLKDSFGVAYLLVEISQQCRTWGIAHCQEGPRTQP